jgi:sec-independent protein translocase protein TatA
MGELRPWHIIVVAAIVVLLFGAKRLPDTARSLGRSLRILKSETRGMAEDSVRADAGREPIFGQLSGEPDREETTRGSF